MTPIFKKYSVGLDASDFSLKLVQLEVSSKSAKFVSFGEASLKQDTIVGGELRNEDDLSRSLKKAANSVKGQKIKTKKIIVSLPEEKSFIDVLQLPLLPVNELEKAVYFEASKRFPVPLEEMCFDFEVISKNKHLNVLIAACPENIVLPYLRACKKAGFQPIAFEIECQAVARCLTKARIFYKPFLIIDFGENRTSFMIYSGAGLAFTSTIPVSSRSLTESIAKNLKITEKQAKTLKIKQGLLGEKDVLRAMRPVLGDLTGQIRIHINYYQNHTKNIKGGVFLEQVVLAGGGAKLKGLNIFLQTELKIPVRLADVWLNLKKDKIAQGLAGKDELSLATAFGLALRSFREL